MTTPTPDPKLQEIAEKIVIELLEYDNMDFNDEERHYHERKVMAVSDAILEATEQLRKENELLKEALQDAINKNWNELSGSSAFVKLHQELCQQLTKAWTLLDQHAHEFKQLRHALNCEGSDLPQLLKAIDEAQKDKEKLLQVFIDHADWAADCMEGEGMPQFEIYGDQMVWAVKKLREFGVQYDPITGKRQAIDTAMESERKK